MSAGSGKMRMSREHGLLLSLPNSPSLCLTQFFLSLIRLTRYDLMTCADCIPPLQFWSTSLFFLSVSLAVSFTLLRSSLFLLCSALFLCTCYFPTQDALSYCFHRHSCIIGSHTEGPSLSFDCVDYFASFFFSLILLIIIFTPYTLLSHGSTSTYCNIL